MARGEHHDPHSILGAHPTDGGTIVRAFHPDANAAALVAPNGGSGAHAADRPWPVGRLRPGPRARPVRVSRALRLPRRQRVGAGRPVSVRPDPRRGRPAPDRRGHARAAVRRARRARAHARRRGGRELRGLGAERAKRAHRGRLRPMGRPADADALDGRQRRLGALRARHRRRRALQVRDPWPRRHAATQGRSAGVLDAGAPGDGVTRVGHHVVQLVGRRVDGGARGPQPVSVADGGLRGAPRIVAAQPRRLVAGVSPGR